jgi:hypothetical protein
MPLEEIAAPLALDTNTNANFELEKNARRRQQAANGKKRRPRNVAVFGQLSVMAICLTVSQRTTLNV